MNRRGFLGSLLGLIATPIASALPEMAPLEGPKFIPFSDYGLIMEIGRYESFRFIETQKFPPATGRIAKFRHWNLGTLLNN